jgi:hypothetical protein
MKEALYLHETTALVNFSAAYCQTTDEILSSDSFKFVLGHYLAALKKSDLDLYKWTMRDRSLTETVVDIVRLMKTLMVLEVDEIPHPFLDQPEILTKLIEEGYNYWRNLQRCSITRTGANSSLQLANFMEADSKFNQLVLAVYRGAQEKVQGRKNRIYRQLQAGTNASMVIRDIHWKVPEGYEMLKGISFVDSMLLRTPLLLHPRSNKRKGAFQPTLVNPLQKALINRDEWFCYPAKVGSLLMHIYFHRDYAFSGITLANLFELATETEVAKRRPDCIVLFGLQDTDLECNYYLDKTTGIWIGKVPSQMIIEYFGYMKKMCLTLHNVAMMAKGWLPLHGSMVNIHLRNGRSKGVVFIGDSGAGKSETIEAIQLLGEDEILSIDVIFDDMGSLHVENGVVVAQGTEIGAFIRLDDLDKGSPYKTMDRSIFMNPESVNARVIIPVAPYSLIVKNHKVDYFLYANNYENKIGVYLAENAADMKATFVEGKRVAMQTTDEVGISTTYFANPFGPMQHPDICDPLLDKYFIALDAAHVKTGEVYTGLGVLGADDNHLEKTAREVLHMIDED